MLYVKVTEDEINNWYANGSPCDADIDGVPAYDFSKYGPGVYVSTDDISWYKLFVQEPSFEDITELQMLLKFVDVYGKINPVYANSAHSLSKLISWSIEKLTEPIKHEDEWIQSQLQKGASEDVIYFISTFRYFGGQESLSKLEYLFTNGFCYHFAIMLENTFQRGDLVEYITHGHVLFRDNDLKLYDIKGYHPEITQVDSEFSRERYDHHDIGYWIKRGEDYNK